MLRAEHPNILWISGDDHAAYVYGAYGNKKVRTPNLDRLANEGMRFDRAYCNSPVCTASRAAFITGRYPRSVGVTQLRTPLPDEALTLAEMLKTEGYRTAAIGKMHFNSNLKHGFDVRIDTPDYRKWIGARGKRATPENFGVQPPWRPFRDHARVWLNSAYLPVDYYDEDMESTYIAGEAKKFLNEQSDEPFFMMVSFQEPHSPYRFPIEYARRHNPSSFEVFNVREDEKWQVPEIFADLTDEEKRGIQAAYYTSVEYLDLNVGRVLDALEKSGKADNTIVVYTGDHGYMLGQRGRFEKHCSYEPAVRSPLVVRYPDRVKAGSNSRSLVEFIDIVPTLLDLCSVDIPAQVEGGSFASLFENPYYEHRSFVVVEYAENEEAMIRDHNYKLVYITGNRARDDGYKTAQPTGRRILLFDMNSDPEETTNLAGRPEHAERIDSMLKKLADHMTQTDPERAAIPKTDDPMAILDFCFRPRDDVHRNHSSPNVIGRDRAIEIALVEVQAMGWTDYEVGTIREDDVRWSVTMWRLPKSPGSFVDVVISRTGAVFRLGPGR